MKNLCNFNFGFKVLIVSCIFQNVQVQKHNYALWGRISRSGSVNALFFIYFPYSSYFLLSKSAGLGNLSELFARVSNFIIFFQS